MRRCLYVETILFVAFSVFSLNLETVLLRNKKERIYLKTFIDTQELYYITSVFRSFPFLTMDTP